MKFRSKQKISHYVLSHKVYLNLFLLNDLGSFFISILFFKVSLSVLAKLLVYAYNMLSKIEYLLAFPSEELDIYDYTWRARERRSKKNRINLQTFVDD